MRVRTLEIRWHDSKPISTCDFQHIPFKRARPAQERDFTSQSYRFATGGEDNNVRVWMVYPNIMPPSVAEGSASTSAAPHPPRVEYLATLSRHSAPVNVVRFSPSGELIASAGDDGMIIIWAPSTSPQTGSYGSESEEQQYEKEHWKARTVFRCTTMQVYDLAWSPTGEYVIAGSTDNTARIFSVADGSCMQEIAEHSHYVQGVAWDPMNEYIATQSSDRSMHMYSINTKQGGFEVHAIGRHTRMHYQHQQQHQHRHSRTPSSSGQRPRLTRRESVTSDAESVVTSMSELRGESSRATEVAIEQVVAPLTPATSIASTPATMFPPPAIEKATSSRRSSFSGSNAPSSPANLGRFGRSPSPMPALPAIRALPPAAWTSVRLYGDESFTNFFRRLTFSPDGGLLLTPAGQFEDPSVLPGQRELSRGRKGNPTEAGADADSASCVYIYTRANFARSPVAQLPGHKKPSVAVKFSPILYELRSGVSMSSEPQEVKHVAVEVGREENVVIDLTGTPTKSDSQTQADSFPSMSMPSLKHPTPILATPLRSQPQTMPSPALSAADSLRPTTPSLSQPPTPVVSVAPAPVATSGVFALPYRMLFAVATMDTVTIHDTQQAGPVCLLTKLHYDEFTDMTWSPDGQCLMLSSRDGYCTLVVFDEILPTHSTQQHSLQLQSITNHHSMGSASHAASSHSHGSTPATLTVSLPIASASASPSLVRKRSEPPLTPAASLAEESLAGPSGSTNSAAAGVPLASTLTLTAAAMTVGEGSPPSKEPPKKKRRVALTRVGDLDS